MSNDRAHLGDRKCNGGCGAFIARDRGSRLCPACWRAGKASLTLTPQLGRWAKDKKVKP